MNPPPMKTTTLRAATASVFVLAICLCGFARAQDASGPVRVEVKKTDSGWQLLRGGQPYLIKGAGGGDSKELLAKLGGNSFRTWGADHIDDQLAEARKYGLTVAVGIWLKHDGEMDYNDAQKVAAQLEMARQAVRRYKDDPAVLLWGVGNEMEGYKKGDNPAVWKAVEDIAAMIKKEDPNHPTMTVIAEIGAERVPSINKYCPDIDIVGINSYGGVTSVGERYKKLGAEKPYVITEFGPPGTWEIPKNKWKLPLEASSTRKGKYYRDAYERAVLGEKGLCLGSYVFHWGNKIEATPTWYGMFLPDGTQLEAVHVMAEMWSGKAPANRCPQMAVPKIEGSDEVDPGGTVHASVDVSDPDGDPIQLEWVLRSEIKQHGIAGEPEPPPPTFPEAIVAAKDHEVELKMPEKSGFYRLYAYARDGQGNGAVANVPIKVK